MQEAAKKIGCSRPLIISWEAGIAKSIGGAYLLAAAEAYDVSPAWLLGKTDEDGPSNYIRPKKWLEGMYRVEHIRFSDPLWAFIQGRDAEPISSIDVSETYLRSLLGHVPQPGRLKLVTASGDSMAPKVDPGTMVLVDTGINAFEGDGIYLIDLGSGRQLKALQDRGDSVYVVSANAALYPAFPANEGMKVIGKAHLITKLERLG